MLVGARFLVATSEQETDELVLREESRARRFFYGGTGWRRPAELPPRGEFRAKHGISAESKVILFLGRLSAKKSPDLLLEAFCEDRQRDVTE